MTYKSIFLEFNFSKIYFSKKERFGCGLPTKTDFIPESLKNVSGIHFDSEIWIPAFAGMKKKYFTKTPPQPNYHLPNSVA
jgi:hypothetical protein